MIDFNLTKFQNLRFLGQFPTLLDPYRQRLLSVKIVVLYQFTVACIENFASKVETWGLSDGKKGSRLRLCFRVVDDVPEKKGMDLWKQMSPSKCSFTCICGIFLNPSTTTVYAWSAFYPSLRFIFSLQSVFYTQSAFCPWSAVRNLHFILTGWLKATTSACFGRQCWLKVNNGALKREARLRSTMGK